MKHIKFKKFDSSFERRAIKAAQNHVRRIRETARLNTVDEDDDSFEFDSEYNQDTSLTDGD